jgi:hypothetical protein
VVIGQKVIRLKDGKKQKNCQNNIDKRSIIMKKRVFEKERIYLENRRL